ncbi:DUF4870 family protein [Thiomicrorhabdus sediminis]|uniref:Transmembrane protein n=1 Tax=Thiomicrorhabdus sediminis TaxID=2580412 RepID=A0A4P9K4J4_9GAMM|nr:hypothetical protein [Thiomicrorhabdus sediminis]QCU89126.1 hypothetical protein FE785_00025 [Thiomicrorhabdus sediminis]
MSEEVQNTPLENTNSPVENTTIPTIIYVLFIANLIIPFTSLIAVIMAYINKGGNSDYLETHYRFQIRTFWIGLLYVIVGALLTVVMIGWLIILFYIIWLIIRAAKGIKLLGQKQPVPDPASWMFG